jgi:hypothetical protein
MHTNPVFRRALAASALVLAAACDEGGPVAPPPLEDPPPVELSRVTCRVAVAAGSVACAGPSSAEGGARGDLLVGGQGVYVLLTGSAVTYNAGTEVWSANVTVQNLIPQAMGTTDGTTLDPAGVRVFFLSGPTVLDPDGGGPVDILNEDGSATFTATGQPYFQYSEVLSESETSAAKSWQLDVPVDVDSFAFVVAVAAEVPFPNGWVELTPAVDSLLDGASQALTATVYTPVGNVETGASVSYGTSDAGVATVDGGGTVTGVYPGSATITASSTTSYGPVTGTADIEVCTSLPLGGVWVEDMPAGSGICLGGGAEYVAVPINLDESSSLSLSVTGNGIVAVSGPPTPSRQPFGPRFDVSGRGRPRPDDAWESRLRETSRRELTPRMGGARAAPGRGRARGGARFDITPGVPTVGDLMDLNVETGDACTTFDLRVGEVMAVGTHVIVMEDTANPSGGLTTAQYEAIADSFDAVIHPVVTTNFNSPADIDGNGRVIAFYTEAVNQLTPPGSGSFVGGFFFSRDLFPTSGPGACATSNQGEMFYMLAADPAGEHGNVRSVAFILEQTLGTLGHEFQHLINASRRLYVNGAPSFEETWMDEGLAHIAEELIFYEAAGLGPNLDLDAAVFGDPTALDAFFKYGESNFGRLRQWLLSPHTSGPFELDDDLATRGAIWSFLRYAADRTTGADSLFWQDLVNATTAGMENLEEVLGADADPGFRDWAAAMYIDDAAGVPPAAYTQPSWDFRDMYENLDYDPGPACSCAYELDVRDPANGVAEAFTLSEGGAAAYVRMGVTSGAFAGLTVLSGGVAPPATVRIAIIRRE